MRLDSKSAIFGLALAQAIFGMALPAAADHLPVPAVVIYPGDIIRDGMLTDHDFPATLATSGFIDRKSDLIGKAAKRTLLPGQGIVPNAVGLPKLVTIGAMVRLIFEEGGLTISTYASALQGGAAGDLISVRNMESGLTLSGIIAPDGSIHVSNG